MKKNNAIAFSSALALLSALLVEEFDDEVESKETETPPKKERTKKEPAKKQPVVDEDDEDDSAAGCNLDDVRKLSSKLIADKILTAKQIKAKINELGFDAMAAMDVNSLCELYAFMQESADEL